MFGALNRLISRLDSESLPPSQASNSQSSSNDTSYGFQVLRNTNKGLPLEPWFDFIIGINGHYIESPDASLFVTEIRNCAGGFCSLDLWSAKGQRTNSISIPVPPAPESLGLALQLAPLNSTSNVWHVLNIPSPLSPAHLAGLLPHGDYILGSPSGTLRGEGALGELVEDHLNRSLVLWVYNSEFDVVREVEMIPRRGWGGEGALGAILGYGALHRIPVGLGEEVQAPGERLFDAGDRQSTDYTDINDNTYGGNPAGFEGQTRSPPPITSATVAPPPMMNVNAPPSRKPNAGAGTTPAVRTKKGRHHALPVSGFDDMFAEGAKKSAEQDYAPSRKGTPTAPPPRTGSTAPPSAMEEKQNPLSKDNTETTDILGEPGEAEVT